MNDFLTWNSLGDIVSFTSMVFLIVEFTKEMRFIKQIPTKYWSFLISFFLLITVNIVDKSFHFFDLVLYLLTSISISLSSNGISDFNKGRKGK